MPVLPDVHILNDKSFRARYIWNVVVNLLNISFIEGVTVSHPKYRRWSLHLSAGQCSGSSCTSNNAAASSRETRIHCYQLWPPNSPDIKPADYRIWGLVQELVYQTPIQEVAMLQQVGWWAPVRLPAECSRRSNWSVAKETRCLC